MSLFRFANTEYLYLLLVVPLIIAIWIINSYRRRRALKKLGDTELVKSLMPDVSAYRPFVKLIFQILAVILLTLVLARPQFGSKVEEVKREGVEVIIALDVSNSMLAEDIQPNRLTRAKQAISRLVDNLEKDKIEMAKSRNADLEIL